jgi:hypothetical protein
MRRAMNDWQRIGRVQRDAILHNDTEFILVPASELNFVNLKLPNIIYYEKPLSLINACDNERHRMSHNTSICLQQTLKLFRSLKVQLPHRCRRLMYVLTPTVPPPACHSPLPHRSNHSSRKGGRAGLCVLCRPLGDHPRVKTCVSQWMNIPINE